MIWSVTKTFFETILLLYKREQRVLILLVLGFLLLAKSALVASWLSVPELSPVMFKVGMIAFAMSFARILLRVFFPWMDLSAVVEKANSTSLGAGLVAVAIIYLIVEMFHLLSVV